MIKNKINNIVQLSIDEYNDQNNGSHELSNKLEDDLFGGNSHLDSLGLVKLLIIMEQNIEDGFDVSIPIADERAMSQKHSPFRTAGALVDYIKMLLKEM